jgi:hypothetical protein
MFLPRSRTRFRGLLVQRENVVLTATRLLSPLPDPQVSSALYLNLSARVEKFNVDQDRRGPRHYDNRDLLPRLHALSPRDVIQAKEIAQDIAFSVRQFYQMQSAINKSDFLGPAVHDHLAARTRGHS